MRRCRRSGRWRRNSIVSSGRSRELLGEADRERIRRLAGEVPTLVAGPDDDARGPAAGRPAADRPGGADR